MLNNSIVNDIKDTITILYVEDDEVLMKLTKEVLLKFFNNVTSAKNGKEALSLYKKNDYDIILTDINMPVMNGIDLIKKIKKINSKQRFIVTSSHDDSEYLITLINLGVSNFILKPINTDKLLELIVSISEDVTNGKKIEEYKVHLEEMVDVKSGKIKELNKFQHEIIDAVNIPFMIIDAKTYEIIQANKAVVDGENSEELNNKYCYELNGDNKANPDNPYVFLVNQVVATKKSVTIDRAINFKNRGLSFAILYGFPILDGVDGLVNQVILYLIDVTEKRKTEIEFKTSEAKLRVKLHEEKLLLDLTKILNSSRNLKSCIKNILFILSRVFEIPKAALYRFDKEYNRILLMEESYFNDNAGEIGYISEIDFESLSQNNIDKLHNGKIIITHDLKKSQKNEFDFFNKYNVGAFILIPIMNEEDTMGILTFYRAKAFFWNYKQYSLFVAISEIISDAWKRML